MVALGPLLEAAGALLLFIGAYVPWGVILFFFATVPVRGIETPGGWVLPLLALGVLALLVWRWYVRRTPWVHVAIGLLGILLIARVALYVVTTENNVRRARDRLTRSPFVGAEVSVRYEAGLFMTAAAGAAIAAGAVLANRQERKGVSDRRQEQEGRRDRPSCT